MRGGNEKKKGGGMRKKGGLRKRGFVKKGKWCTLKRGLLKQKGVWF